MGWESRIDPEFLTDDLRAEMYDPESLAFERHRRLEVESLVPLGDLCTYIHAADPASSTLAAAATTGVPLVSARDVIALRDDPSLVTGLVRLPRDRVGWSYGQDTLLLVAGESGQTVLNVEAVPGLEEYVPIGAHLYVLKPRAGVSARYLEIVLQSEGFDAQLWRAEQADRTDPKQWVSPRREPGALSEPVEPSGGPEPVSLDALRGLLVPAPESTLGRHVLAGTFWGVSTSPAVRAARSSSLVTPITPRDAARNALAIVAPRFNAFLGDDANQDLWRGLYLILERLAESPSGIVGRAIEEIHIGYSHGERSYHLSGGWDLSDAGTALESHRAVVVNVMYAIPGWTEASGTVQTASPSWMTKSYDGSATQARQWWDSMQSILRETTPSITFTVCEHPDVLIARCFAGDTYLQNGKTQAANWADIVRDLTLKLGTDWSLRLTLDDDLLAQTHVQLDQSKIDMRDWQDLQAARSGMVTERVFWEIGLGDPGWRQEMSRAVAWAHETRAHEEVGGVLPDFVLPPMTDEARAQAQAELDRHLNNPADVLTEVLRQCLQPFLLVGVRTPDGQLVGALGVLLRDQNEIDFREELPRFAEALQAELDRQMAQRERIQREIADEVIGRVAHIFRNRLGNLDGDLKRLRQHAATRDWSAEWVVARELAAELAEEYGRPVESFTVGGYLERLDGHIDQMRHVVGRVRQYFRGSHSPPEDIDVNVELQRAVHGWSARRPDVPAVCALDALAPTVRMSLDAFHEVLDNILDNSNRYVRTGEAPPGGHRLDVTSRVDRNRIVVEIRNTGESTLPPNPTGLWTTTNAGEGTGLGLATVTRNVREAGGRFEILVNEPGPGVTNRIVLPNARWERSPTDQEA